MIKNEKTQELVDRLQECFKIVGGASAMADMTDIPKRTLDSYLYSGVEPKWSNLKSIGEAARVSFDWLVAGSSQAPHGFAGDDESSVWDEYALVSGYSIQVSAGAGAIPSGEEVTRRLAFRRSWLKYRGLREENLLVVFARGDSMLPTINDNDTIMVDTSETSPQDGRMYVIRVEEHLLVKRTQIVPGQGVMLISDNKDYPPMLVKFTDPESDVKVVGRVVWVGKDV